jgi:large-conductance mechanosensitive channel
VLPIAKQFVVVRHDTLRRLPRSFGLGTVDHVLPFQRSMSMPLVVLKFTNTIRIGDGVIAYGSFLTALVDLLITGAVLFAIVKAYDTYRSRKRAAGEELEEPSEDLHVLREIRDPLRERA